MLRTLLLKRLNRKAQMWFIKSIKPIQEGLVVSDFAKLFLNIAQFFPPIKIEYTNYERQILNQISADTNWAEWNLTDLARLYLLEIVNIHDPEEYERWLKNLQTNTDSDSYALIEKSRHLLPNYWRSTQRIP